MTEPVKKPEPVLTKGDVQSPVWLKLKAHLEAELSYWREQNDAKSLTEVETAFIRGEIRRIKRLLQIEADAK